MGILESRIAREAGVPMADQNKHPFQSFSFWMIEGRRPRVLLRLTAPAEDASAEGGSAGTAAAGVASGADGFRAGDADAAGARHADASSAGAPQAMPDQGLFTLTVQKGSAANPTSKITRQVPAAAAERLRDGLQRAGAFSWEESYGDSTAPGSLRWALAVVFQKDVFSIEAKGGSDVPPGFPQLLEELYALDFPRPAAEKPQGAAGVGRAIGDTMGALGVGSIGGMSAGDLGAYAATKGAGGDFSYLRSLFGGAGGAGLPEGLEGFEGLGDFDPAAIDPQEAAKLFAEMQRNPEAMQKRLRDEFRHLSPDEQNRMLDALAGLGLASRAWWERFFRGL